MEEERAKAGGYCCKVMVFVGVKPQMAEGRCLGLVFCWGEGGDVGSGALFTPDSMWEVFCKCLLW